MACATRTGGWSCAAKARRSISSATAPPRRSLAASPSLRRRDARAMNAHAVSSAAARAFGVIGAGAMGGGVVQSLVRAGVTTYARDIRAEAQAAAVRHGARPTATPAELARACEAVILLVVDAA